MTHPAFQHTDHRPWPLPAAAWTWRQSWRDLLFAHWPVPVEAIRPLVPAALDVQQFDGTSWLGIVPFRMAGVMRRPLPDLPYVSAFPELNVRVYVERDGRPGVWFLSLDATNRLAVAAARAIFHLPYYRASIDITPDGDGFHYDSRRAEDPPAAFRAAYRPVSAVYRAAPGTLEHWLTERYCLYAEGAGRSHQPHRGPPRALAAAAGNGRNSRSTRSRPPADCRSAGRRRCSTSRGGLMWWCGMGCG